jgi:tRNA pseudouridine55 synthase
MRRKLDGILVLDKPTGITSNGALQQAKRLFGAAKAGHTGTLDPLASGVLPVLFGEATKFSSFLLEADKEYVADVQLGTSTSTGDAEGQVLSRSAIEVDDAAIAAALVRFHGEHEQIPPMHSALKLGGRPLYEMARQGVTVERAPRRIAIRELEVLGRSAGLLRVRLSCSKGTYVRVFAQDLGVALGTGAHLAGLRRTVAGRFRLEQAVSLAALGEMESAARDRLLLPIEALLESLPPVELDSGTAGAFLHGRTVAQPHGRPGRCRVYGAGAELLGVGEVGTQGDLRPLRLLARDPGATQAAEIPTKTL